MNEVPMFLFIILTLLAFAGLFVSIKVQYPINLVSGIITIMLGFFLSKTSINGTLVQNFGDVTSFNSVATGNYVIEIPALGWLFLFVAIISVGIVIKIIIDEINYQIEPILEEEF